MCSNFNCEKCGQALIDTPGGGYITECEHYPMKNKVNEIKQVWTPTPESERFTRPAFNWPLFYLRHIRNWPVAIGLLCFGGALAILYLIVNQ